VAMERVNPRSAARAHRFQMAKGWAHWLNTAKAQEPVSKVGARWFQMAKARGHSFQTAEPAARGRVEAQAPAESSRVARVGLEAPTREVRRYPTPSAEAAAGARRGGEERRKTLPLSAGVFPRGEAGRGFLSWGGRA
jgi:hypothetical protein